MIFLLVLVAEHHLPRPPEPTPDIEDALPPFTFSFPPVLSLALPSALRSLKTYEPLHKAVTYAPALQSRAGIPSGGWAWWSL